MNWDLLKFYRYLPWFKGKLRMGKVFFKKYLNQTTPVTFGAHKNIKYKIPNTLESLGIELLINGIYEKKIVRFLNRHITEDCIYFDVGANIGAIGIPIIKCKTRVKYFGFEASPVVFEYLEYNFKKNKINNYELHNCLVHENNDQIMKFYQSEYYGKSSLAPTYTNQSIYIKSICLDSFCNDRQLTHINWMKVDVQGFEFFVFKGLQNLLFNKKIDNILFEFEYWAEAAAGLEKGDAQKYLLGSGYELFDINGKKLETVIIGGRAMIWAKPKALFSK